MYITRLSPIGSLSVPPPAAAGPSQHDLHPKTRPYYLLLKRITTPHQENTIIGVVVGLLLAAFLAGCFYFLCRYGESMRIRRQKARQQRRRRRSTRKYKFGTTTSHSSWWSGSSSVVAAEAVPGPLPGKG
ncbi:hypothetical protein QBC43DRAFT_318589 [Cladorrhinum sp. PSN259]|nr:hypothetical protein QBC43DRAFT_318589 [Cladorrhinum sp. PSN259]